MNIELIKKLRAETNSAMNDCKLALQECNNDYEKALDWLKAKNLVIASSKQNNLQKEGRVFAFSSKGRYYIGKCLCETDFCAKSKGIGSFEEFIHTISFDVENLFNADDSVIETENIKSNIKMHEVNFTATLKEKVSFGGAKFLDENKNSQIFSYIHSNGKIGALVQLEIPHQISGLKEINELGANLAMQVVASNPLSLKEEDLSQEYKNRQYHIFSEQIKETNIREDKRENAINGKMKKWYKEICLLEQPAIWLQKTLVKDAISQIEKELNTKIKVVNYIREEI